jgi:integrase
MKLTDRTAAGLKVPQGKIESIYFDDEVPGFGLRLRAGGSRRWIFQYRLGKENQRRISLGAQSAQSAQRARDIAKKLHAQVTLGRDPASEKADAKARAAETFGTTVKRFLPRQRLRLKPRSYTEVERHLLSHWKPLHGLPITAIRRRTVAARLGEIAADNGPFAADRARASASAFFTWAMKEGLVENNPVIGTNKAAEGKPRDRVLSDDELCAVWNALGDDPYGSIIKLLILTGQRREEIGALRWSEVDFDRDVIVFPGARTKNHRSHEVPLSSAVRSVLRAQPLRSNADGTTRDLIFGEGHGGWQAWSQSKDRLDLRIRDAWRDKRNPMPPWRLHDLRRTAVTRMADLGVQPNVIEAIINHVSGHKAGVAGVYNRATYDMEKRRALDLWADRVAAMTVR